MQHLAPINSRLAVLLVIASPGCTETPAPILVSASPGDGQTGVRHDTPLELVFAEEVSSGELNGLALLHDGVEETGRLEVVGNIAHYWPDNGWFVGTTYQVELPGVDDSQGEQVEPWSFTTGSWRQLGAAPTCTESIRDPTIATAPDGSLRLFGEDFDNGLRACLLEWSQATSWSSPTSLAGNALFAKRLIIADDGQGLASGISNESGSLFVSKLTGEALLEQPMAESYAAALSSSGQGLIAWADDSNDARVQVRRYSETGFSEPELLFEHASLSVQVGGIAAAAGEDGSLTVVWKRTSFETNEDTIFLATSEASGSWDVEELETIPFILDGSGARPAVSALQLSFADDGWIHFVWQREAGFSSGDGEVWSMSYHEGQTALLKLADFSALPPVLATNGPHTAVVWAEQTENDRQIAVRRVSQGEWGPANLSTIELSPSSDLSAAIDLVGNLALTWMEYTTLCVGRYHAESWDEQCEFLPQPTFTSPTASIKVGDRGRAFLAWFGGDVVELATFD